MARNNVLDQIEENKRNINRSTAILRDVDNNNLIPIDLRGATITMDVDAIITKKELNNNLISGHPTGDKHGSGNGVSGWLDYKNETFLNQDITAKTEDGKRELLDTLTDNILEIQNIVLGTQSTPSDTDQNLDNEEQYTAVNIYNGSNLTTSTTDREIEWYETDLNIQNVGTETNNTLISNSLLDDNIDMSTNKYNIDVEVLYTFNLRFEEENSIVKKIDEKLAETLSTSDSNPGIKNIKIGTGDTQPTSSDSDIETEIFDRDAAYNIDTNKLVVETILFRDEPSTQPHDVTESTVHDENGNLLQRTIFSPEEKNNENRMRVRFTYKLI